MMNLFTSDRSKSYQTDSLIEIPLISLGSFIICPSLWSTKMYHGAV